VTRLGPRAHDPVRASHLTAALLTGGQQVQVILVQPAQQLPAPRLQPFLQLRMPQPRGLIAGQPRLQLGVILPGLREHPAARRSRVLVHRAPSLAFWS
jgi:hypothetical protein